MNKLGFLIFLFVLTFLLSPLAHATESTHTLYFRSDIVTVNGKTGYALNESRSASNLNASDYYVGASYQTVYWGWRVWQVDYNHAETELTSGAPEATVTLSANTSGLQTATWTPPETSLWVGFDSLKLTIYSKMGAGAWTAKATFTTETLSEKNVTSDTWTFSMYLIVRRYASAPSVTETWFIWGSSTYDSHIEDVTFADPNTYEKQGMEMMKGNFLNFIVAPWTNLVGATAFWSVVVLFIPFMGIYIRTKSTIPLLLIVVLFGGSGGIFTFILGDIGVGALLWVFCLLSLTGLLYKVFR